LLSPSFDFSNRLLFLARLGLLVDLTVVDLMALQIEEATTLPLSFIDCKGQKTPFFYWFQKLADIQSQKTLVQPKFSL